ncbi:uncharacterized protein OCT59_010607 [Rhizophagus irregularis]|uniref:uncharacterized protein n=1 Tax=Rhizophagus irregularis TaxID=588596 RepID=UPI003334819D|nr:hypothetical protein OCT59_010607 [Rhizophagus irregularis]
MFPSVIQSLLNKIRSEIFKFIDTPISLILTDRYNTLSDHSELVTKAEGHEVLNNHSELSAKGNDMELFHFL